MRKRQFTLRTAFYVVSAVCACPCGQTHSCGVPPAQDVRPSYAEETRAYCKRIGSSYADDKRGIWTLAVTKLVGMVGLGIVTLIGGSLMIAFAMSE